MELAPSPDPVGSNRISMRLLVIGTGSIGERHLRVFQHLTDKLTNSVSDVKRQNNGQAEELDQMIGSRESKRKRS